jgi:mannose-6-phosphate isomerase-like protein (cupin superfamily)
VALRGETIENPVTGERITFVETAADTRGELLRFELVMPPGVGVPVAHVHCYQEERFELLAGAGRFRVGRDVVRARTGDIVVVPPGAAHRFWNDGDEELRVTVDFRPALRTEQFFEQLWGGGLTRFGLPGLRLATELAGQGYLEEVSLPWIPMAVQRAMQRVLAALGRRRRRGAAR